MSRALLAYIPAIHRGYIEFICRHQPDAETLYVVGDDLLAEIPRAKREFPLTAQNAVAMLQACNGSDFVLRGGIHMLTAETLHALDVGRTITSRHLVTEAIVDKYGLDVEWDHHFLRWDLPAAMSEVPVHPNIQVKPKEFFREYFKLAELDAGKSGNFFRQVGACLVKNGVPIMAAHNRGGEYEGEEYILGNPRVWIDGGHAEINPDIHAEQMIIMEALRQGISLKGADLYVTTFPCRTCANLLALSGLSRVLFRDGYSVLGSEEVLLTGGIKLVRVED